MIRDAEMSIPEFDTIALAAIGNTQGASPRPSLRTSEAVF